MIFTSLLQILFVITVLSVVTLKYLRGLDKLSLDGLYTQLLALVLNFELCTIQLFINEQIFVKVVSGCLFFINFLVFFAYLEHFLAREEKKFWKSKRFWTVTVLVASGIILTLIDFLVHR